MTSWKLLLLIGALASLSITAALAILVLLFGDFGNTEARILGTTFAVSVAALLALPGAILLDRGASVQLGWACVILAGAAFVSALVGIWGGDSVTTAKLLGTLASWAAASTQISALRALERDDDPRGVRRVSRVATALALLLAALVSFAVWTELDSSTFLRVIAALAVLDVFLLVLRPILRRLQAEGPPTTRVVLQGTPAQIDEALRRVEGTGVAVRR